MKILKLLTVRTFFTTQFSLNIVCWVKIKQQHDFNINLPDYQSADGSGSARSSTDSSARLASECTFYKRILQRRWTHLATRCMESQISRGPEDQSEPSVGADVPTLSRTCSSSLFHGASGEQQLLSCKHTTPDPELLFRAGRSPLNHREIHIVGNIHGLTAAAMTFDHSKHLQPHLHNIYTTSTQHLHTSCIPSALRSLCTVQFNEHSSWRFWHFHSNKWVKCNHETGSKTGEAEPGTRVWLICLCSRNLFTSQLIATFHEASWRAPIKRVIDTWVFWDWSTFLTLSQWRCWLDLTVTTIRLYLVWCL